MQLPFTLSLHPSRQLAALLAAAHGLAAAAVLSLSLPWWLMLVLLAAILASAWRGLARLTSSHRICRLTLRDDGQLEFLRVDGSGGEARVQPQTTVTAFLCVLLLRAQGRGEALVPLVLLPDALDAEDFRLLRLWLRWRAGREGQAAGL